MYNAGKKCVHFLLLAVLCGSGNFFTMERGDTAGDAYVKEYCRMPERCNVDSFNDWFKVDDHCVKYFTSPLNFTEAEFRCRTKAPGGHLVSVHNRGANNYLLCIVKRRNPRNLRIWLGGYEFFRSGKFHWLDGSFWDYQSWVPGEPNNIYTPSEECVEMNWKHVGMWNDASCHVRKNYICAFKRKNLLDE